MRWLGLGLAIALAVGVTPPSIHADEGSRILVAVRPGKSLPLRQGMARLGTAGSHVQILSVPRSQQQATIDSLSRDPNIRFVEVDHPVQSQDVPNDPVYAGQWNMAKIKADQGWTVSTGDANMVIAILDTGIDPTHQEFAGRLLPGYNFVGNNTNTADDHGHGTHVAGIAAATGNNSFGVAGLAWKSPILPVKVLASNGGGYISDLIRGMDFARENGAKVMNISLGSTTSSKALEEAVDRALDADIVVVAAAGNNGTTTNAPLYPAALPGVVAVGSTDTQDSRAGYSTTGSFLTVSAPGSAIYSTAKGGGFTTMSGTSMATPHVAGLAVLIRSQNPTLTQAQVFKAIASSSVDLGAPGVDPIYGAGRIDVSMWASPFIPAKVPGTSNSPPNLSPNTPTSGGTPSTPNTFRLALPVAATGVRW